MALVMILMLSCAGAPVSAGSEKAKLTVWPSISKGQVIMTATMPKLDRPSFVCIIAKSEHRGEFVGQLEAPGRASVEVRGPVQDMYKCVPCAFRPGDQIRLVALVDIDKPVGITGQIQTVPGK